MGIYTMEEIINEGLSIFGGALKLFPPGIYCNPRIRWANVRDHRIHKSIRVVGLEVDIVSSRICSGALREIPIFLPRRTGVPRSPAVELSSLIVSPRFVGID
tara:strand:+ start:1006 stop:1311 length:306 start_codon:yes stop_codon:yes gene_type:complete